jgi:Uma2 family endonuclease
MISERGIAIMPLVHSRPETELYPESDGKPMAETDVHLDCMIYIRAVLKWRYRGERVYVGSNLLVYYAKARRGQKGQAVAPDNFVVKDCDPGMRRVFKIWEEGRVPNTVFEVTSLSTRAEDELEKPGIYGRMGVKELFLFDPTGDYLDPPLQGYRFVRGERRRIEPDETGALTSKELGIRLRLEDGCLTMYDGRSGERLLTEAEAERQGKEAERRATTAERIAREAAEEEIRRLKAQLARRPPAGG